MPRRDGGVAESRRATTADSPGSPRAHRRGPAVEDDSRARLRSAFWHHRRRAIDAQLLPALARMLTEHGPIAVHVIAIGPGNATDQTLWTYAIDRVTVLVTKDEDFRDMLLLRGSPPVVVWVRVGNTRRQALLDWFKPLIERVVEFIESANPLVELR
ncbi:MAG: DUF5615 family PIN-like protein [Salinibacterium sp.]|nr:DUF5615 family PIN-like protein [Salinibacterium sp.]